MYAIVEQGGKQYKVTEGAKLFVEKIDAKVGAKQVLEPVLLIGGDGNPTIGTPAVAGAKVEAEVIEQGKDKKILVLKKKRRKGYRKMQGHRQAFTVLKVNKIII
ncbi:MAG: 50S ribosomal protein L21 [Deltaproteobacteria bacterium]|nr:50S ribosomal protein L21 [Deltaproteobacteria bacterium]